MSNTCPRCHAPAVRTPDGRYLTPEPTEFGINRPDGGKFSVQEIRDAARARRPIGHSYHECAKQPTTPALF